MTPDNTTPPSSPAVRKPSSRFGPWFFVALAALALAGWQWFETRQRLAEIEQETSRRLAAADAGSKEDRGELKQMREQIDGLQGKLGAADARLAEIQAQSAAVQALYQDLAGSRDESGVLEAEQAIALAGQQLQLAGNVPAAIVALRSAEARLARVDRPQLLPLRKALAADLERLTALPVVDLAAVNARLEQVLLTIDNLPLAMDMRPPETREKPAEAAQLPWWERTVAEIWQELKGLVRIQRFDRDEAMLLAPGQSFFLRENLKLRLLNARLALFSRDQATFRGELKAALEMLGRLFDVRDKGVEAAQATLRQLLATEIVIALPGLNETQAALRVLHNGKEKK
ncbi:MAG: uroporphyrinogen-III C-methyltransferase [Candidatus Dechloromonas phosphoritropha]